MITVESLGAGVQSSTTLMKAELGEIFPRPDVAVFADTQDEPREIYEWLNFLKANTSIPIKTVSRGDLREDNFKVRTRKKDGKEYIKVNIPVYTDGVNSKGMFQRICTQDYKIDVIIKAYKEIIGKEDYLAWRRKFRTELKLHADFNKRVALWTKEKKAGEQVAPPIPTPEEMEAWNIMQANALVCQLIGISTDEAHRMKKSRVPWLVNRYPLIEQNMSRGHCKEWFRENFGVIPPRSACEFCPYHSDEEWLALSPESFQAAVEFERRLHEFFERGMTRFRDKPYLHEDCIPLDQVKFDVNKTLDLFGNECEGMCGI